MGQGDDAGVGAAAAAANAKYLLVLAKDPLTATCTSAVSGTKRPTWALAHWWTLKRTGFSAGSVIAANGRSPVLCS